MLGNHYYPTTKISFHKSGDLGLVDLRSALIPVSHLLWAFLKLYNSVWLERFTSLASNFQLYGLSIFGSHRASFAEK